MLGIKINSFLLLKKLIFKRSFVKSGTSVHLFAEKSYLTQNIDWFRPLFKRIYDDWTT